MIGPDGIDRKNEATTQQWREEWTTIFGNKKYRHFIVCPYVGLTGCAWEYSQREEMDIPTMFRELATHLERKHNAINIIPFIPDDWENDN